jgi:adenylate cyclase class 2
MNKLPLEIEVKFYLTDLSSYEKRVRSIGASLVRLRTHEINFRFDTPDLTLTRSHQVLRLRQDIAAVLTYKGEAVKNESVSIRPEIELEVNDFQKAQNFLVALGYQLVVKYEKWRTVYQLGELEITIDEMPFGSFTEIEAGDSSLIQKTASILALDWSTRITDSYLQLFDNLKTKRNISSNDLTFEALKDIEVKPEDLGVKPSDLPVYF